MMNLIDKIRVIEDFPEPGISFKDITTLLRDPLAFHYAIDQLADFARDKQIDMVVGPEARGFVVGAPLAYALGVGFVPIRKPGKLPAKTIRENYELEYGKDGLELHADGLLHGERVLIVDDLLATGGTINSAVHLVENLGAHVAGICFLIELKHLEGRKKLSSYDVFSLVQYD